ncbi:plasmid mobilization relaxosome protein MobC (plasmid) [Moraxella osloensis]|nr:MobC family plasmid mobilization relaxosome protein [Moraxella osloensis]MBL7668505.1 plasmid mobilization relaxosome protein MobC [Moraxella osloensis]
MPKIKGAKRTLEVKINETEWNELQQRKTKSLAGWLRDLGLGAVPIRQADPALIRHLARIGSNLNQIARHANTEKQLDVQVLQELAKANALLDQLVTQAEQD